MARRVSFELTFEPVPGLIGPTRRFIQDSVQPLVRDPDDVSRIAMAAHELMENAVQYGVGRVTKLGVAISRADEEEAGEVALRLTNEATPSHIERLRAGVAALVEPSRALEHYRYLMMREWDVNQESSGMGLARIVVESEMKLAVEVDGPRVVLSASGRLGGVSP